jgi:zinc transporter ZupT
MENSLWLSVLTLFGASMLGGSLALVWKIKNNQWLKLLLAFSAAYLLGLTVLHLFPELYESEFKYAGWFVIIGFLLQVVLDFFSHGVEHGHAHVHAHVGHGFLFMVMASLWIHAFIEGMPFGASAEVHEHELVQEAHHHAHDHNNPLLLGISMHKVTEAFVLATLLLQVGMKKLRAWLLLGLFACVAPLGAFVHHWLDESGLDASGWGYTAMIGILIGILLHVSTIILFESEEGHKFNWMKFVAILLGIASAGLIG